MLGSISDADSCYGGALKIDLIARDFPGVAHSFRGMANVRIEKADYEHSDWLLERSIALSEEHGFDQNAAKTTLIQGYRALILGDYLGSLEDFKKASEECDRYDLENEKLLAQVRISQVQYLLGDLQKAADLAQNLFLEMPEEKFSIQSGIACRVLAEVLLADGAPKKAHQYISKAMDLHKSGAYELEVNEDIIRLSRVLVALGDPGLAREYLDVGWSRASKSHQIRIMKDIELEITLLGTSGSDANDG